MGQTAQNIIAILEESFFGTSSVPMFLPAALYLAGTWKMLEKSDLKGWWALIPCAREYQLARCAGREPEGRAASVAEFLRLILTAFGFFLSGLTGRDSYAIPLLIGTIILQLIVFNYRLQIYSGLIQVYDARKRWMWLWALQGLRWIPAFLWGWQDKWQPEWKVVDLQREIQGSASLGSVGVMEKGLTVNLRERSVREFFQKKTLLWDIHMYIPQGHMVLLLGGSGAGKTTFVNAVNGYEKADAEVVLNGTDMYRQYKKMQYETGFVPQQDLMRYHDTVNNTLMDAAKLRLPKDISSEIRKKRVREVMEIFGLMPVRHSLVQKLSGGQKKRLSIAMELLSNPSLFILDEPDSGLDGVMARELMQQLRHVADSGRIVLVITHTPDRVIDFFDDVIVLAKDASRTGRLAFFGSIEEARAFFGCTQMEQIVRMINGKEEGGSGRADEFVEKFREVQHA